MPLPLAILAVVAVIAGPVVVLVLIDLVTRHGESGFDWREG